VKRLVAIALCLLGVVAAADWYWLNPLPTANNLTSVWFVGDTGYACGPTTIRTTDGGANWSTLATRTFDDVQFPVDGHTGYATGWGIAKTTDAGVTWAYVQIGSYDYTHGICFPAGNDTGYATYGFEPPRLVKTCDGFTTYSTLGMLNGFYIVTDIAFSDTRHGWVVGRGGGLYGGFIFRTTDGGASWMRQDSGYAMGRRWGVCALSDGQTGFACGYESLVMKTTDGGEHWYGLPSPDVDEVSAVSFPSGPDTGFAVSTDDRIYRTVDGGQTWDSCPGTQYANAMHFPSGTRAGYAVGPSGTLVKTTDAGASWTSLTRYASGTGRNVALIDVDFPADEATGFAVGGDGAFIKTTDGGQSWFQPCVFDTFICQWDAVDFLPDKLTGFICGTAGSNNSAVLRTRDGGVSWDTVKTYGGIGAYRDILFPFGDDTGYLVDRVGRAVWKTTDCGDSWVRHGVPGSYANAVDFPTPAVGYEVGDNGDIAKTTDGGETWSDVSTIFQDDLYGVEFPVGPDTGWVCGGYGRVCRTTDGAATWEMQNAPQEFFWSICFPAGTHLGFCSGEGVLMTTTDGGVTWIYDASLTTQDLWAMQFPLNAGTGYVVGSGGTILKTGYGGGIEEREKSEVRRVKPGATLIRGMLDLGAYSRQHSAYRAELLDAAGRKAVALRAGANDVSRLPPGVYFVHSTLANRHSTIVKVIIAR
jgi:photosystem II stability/assembly factor-like uncharacterized protein